MMLLKSLRGWIRNWLLVWLLPIGILTMWQFLVQFEVIPRRMLPMPTEVLETGRKLLHSGELAEHIAVSAGRAFAGLLIGGGIAFLLGLINGMFRPSERLFDSTIQMARTVPNLALTPLVILWFGIGDAARVFLISLGVFFPIYLNTFHGG
jgi:sulfonate transport system permease protein